MGRARFANLVSCLVARPFCAGEVVAESALSAPLVIQGGWLQKMEDTPEANARDHSLMVLARHCVKATQKKLSDLREAAPPASSMSSMLSAALARRPLAVERVEERLDEFVASVLRIWCLTAGPQLEGNWMVELIQGRPLLESAPLIAVGLIMGTLYVSFRLAYMPAVHLPLSSTSSVIFHSSFVLAVLSYERGITVDPGSIPENWRKAENGRPHFELEGGRVFIHERKKTTGELRFCNKEMKFKPDRAHYCSVMRRNVLRMDHYCLWLANCVGYHNHKYFFLFLFYTLIATGTLDIGVLHTLYFHTHSAGHTFMMAQGAMVSSVLAALLGPFFSFHCWLMRHNMTTIEYCEKMRDNEESRISHYDIGLFRNIQCVLGDNWMLWLLPISGPSGDGLQWGIAEQKNADARAASSSTPVEEEKEENEAAADSSEAAPPAPSQSSSSSAEPWVAAAARFAPPPCVYQAGHALQEICGNMAEYYERIRDNDNTRILPGLGGVFNIQWTGGNAGEEKTEEVEGIGRSSSTAAESTADGEEAGDLESDVTSREDADSPTTNSTFATTDLWAALSNLAAQSRHCVAQSRRCPALASPVSVYEAGHTLQEMCGDVAVFMENKARAAGLLQPQPGLVESVVPKQRSASSSEA